VRTTLRCLATLICFTACNEKVGHQQPLGTTVDTDAQIQRYLRRVYLDVTGKVPSDTDLDTSTSHLRDAQNTPTARGSLVDDLMAKPEWGTTWASELENTIFAGNTLAQQYALICGIIRGDTTACQSCTDPDPCNCQCGNLPQLLTERTQLATSATDFSGGTKSSTIERRYAAAVGYYALAGDPDTRTKTLFTDFLGRTAEADETDNGRMMIIGALITGSPAGILFHRYGSNYTDMLDIIFTSEVYREALVRRVFERYLARDPSGVELSHFVSTLDAMEPDLRSVVRAVVSSREYFDQ
jgi:hypothetical protein